MQGYRDDGVVLRTQKLGEADRIITLLTRHNGRVRAVAKGVRRTKSRFGARLEPFTHVDVMIHPGRSLDVITQAEVIRAYGTPLVTDYPKYTAGTAMLETAERFTPVEKEPAIRQFLLLIGGLRALGEAIDPIDPATSGDSVDLIAPVADGDSGGSSDPSDLVVGGGFGGPSDPSDPVAGGGPGDPRGPNGAEAPVARGISSGSEALVERSDDAVPGNPGRPSVGRRPGGLGGPGVGGSPGDSGGTEKPGRPDAPGSGERPRDTPRDPRMVLDAYFLRSLTFAGYAPALTECARCGVPGTPVAARASRSGASGGGGASGSGVHEAGDTRGNSSVGTPGNGSGPGTPVRTKPLVAFAIAAGGMVCADCRPPGSASPAPQTVALMLTLLRGDWDEAMLSERRHRVECSGLVAAYLQWHLEHSIRSLRHVERA